MRSHLNALLFKQHFLNNQGALIITTSYHSKMKEMWCDDKNNPQIVDNNNYKWIANNITLQQIQHHAFEITSYVYDKRRRINNKETNIPKNE